MVDHSREIGVLLLAKNREEVLRTFHAPSTGHHHQENNHR